MKREKLSSALSPAGVLQLLSQNESPIRFVTPTSALLPGMESWIGNFEQINLTDSFDGQGRNALIATGLTTQDFATNAEAVSSLLHNEDVQSQLHEGDFVFSTLDSEGPAALTEGQCFHLLRENKIATSLKLIENPPNYGEFRKQCRTAGLSFSVEAVVADAAAGSRPLLIASEEDWNSFEQRLANQDLICTQPPQGREYAVEAVATADGPVMSPLQHLYRDHYWGVRHWTGASIAWEAGDAERKPATSVTGRIGTLLAASGYRGAYSVELATEPSTGKMLVSRLVTSLGVNSLLSHVVTSKHGGFPLHLLHILSKLDSSAAVDIAAMRSQYDNHDSWSVLAVRHVGPAAEMITRAPRSGLYEHLAASGVQCIDQYADWNLAVGAKAFYLRLQGPGNYRAPGSLLGLIYMRSAGLDELHLPTRDARQWIEGLAAQYAGLPVSGSSLPHGITTQPLADIL